jgi:uncharacterized repeat protein (TIGR03803 family)
VFRITPSGTLTTLYSFCAQTGCADGSAPSALVQGTNGSFYGTTYNGGVYTGGTVFKITPGGTLTTLYSFCAQTNSTDGFYPYAGLVQATDGNFYGTTQNGGANTRCNSIGCGTVFKITPGGKLTTLHSFRGLDGNSPNGLVQGTDGSFYGTTFFGGAYNVGTVFKITAGGTLTTLNSLDGSSSSDNPGAGLAQGTDVPAGVISKTVPHPRLQLKLPPREVVP